VVAQAKIVKHRTELTNFRFEIENSMIRFKQWGYYFDGLLIV